MRHVFLELLKLHPRLLDRLLRLLDRLLRLLDDSLGATLLDDIDDEEDKDDDEEDNDEEDKDEHAVQRQLKSSKLHR